MIALVFGLMFSAVAQETPAVDRLQELRLSDYLQRVVERNETLQGQLLATESARRKYKAERGIFEPSVTAAVTREANKRTNNVQQAAAQGSSFFFSERNTIADGGVQSLLPTGAKIRLGVTMSDLVNNVNPFGGFLTPSNNQFYQQYQTFVGGSLTQPLLKNGGIGITMANIRIAALDSEIAFQDYRRQLMLTLSQAESAYWNLYFAQEQLRFFEESVSVAGSILNDMQEKVKAGQAAELEELEAQSGLALRKTKRNEALQNYYDAMSQVRAFASGTPTRDGHGFRVTDVPVATNVVATYGETFQTAFNYNPDYLAQQKKVAQEKMRYDAMRNQLLPELNVKGSYGYNGLGLTPGDSFDMVSKQGFPSWSVGLELIVPALGNIKGRNQYAAARLTYQEAIATLDNVETQVANTLDASVQKARSWQDSIQSYATVVRFNEDLLKTQRERLNVGKIEPRKVLEVEADLLDARQSLAQALVQFQRALLQCQMVGGTLLQTRGLELSREELKRKTLAMLNERQLPMDVHDPILETRPSP